MLLLIKMNLLEKCYSVEENDRKYNALKYGIQPDDSLSTAQNSPERRIGFSPKKLSILSFKFLYQIVEKNLFFSKCMKPLK